MIKKLKLHVGCQKETFNDAVLSAQLGLTAETPGGEWRRRERKRGGEAGRGRADGADGHLPDTWFSK